MGSSRKKKEREERLFRTLRALHKEKRKGSAGRTLVEKGAQRKSEENS